MDIMEDMNEMIYKALEQMITSVQQLSELFINDHALFKTNDLATINISNEKKLNLLNSLGNSAAQLQKSLPTTSSGQNQTLSDYLNQIDYHHASRIRSKINALHEQLTSGYQQLLCNNQVVTHNLGMINDIWERLLRISRQNLGVYEKPEMK
jgi:hypothetical protein